MRITIRASAFADLENIFNWIAQDSPMNARAVVDRIEAAIVNVIAPFPFMGRAGKLAGTREWIVRGLPYIVVYQVDDSSETVAVLGIVHGARDR